MPKKIVEHNNFIYTQYDDNMIIKHHSDNYLMAYILITTDNGFCWLSGTKKIPLKEDEKHFLFREFNLPIDQ